MTTFAGKDGLGATVAHVVAEYLPRSETFIYTTLRFQGAVRPVVFAERTSNLGEFPFDPVVTLPPPRPEGRPLRRPAGIRSLGDRRTERATADAISHFGCDLIHAHFGHVGVKALPVARRLGLPLVTTFYGWDLSFPSRYPEWKRRYQRLFADGSRFLCEGPAMASRLQELGCPDDKISVVRIGLDVAALEFRPRRRARPLIVLQTARFVDKKGVDLSIRAFAGARERLGPSELWLVGDGPDRPHLERLAVSLGVGDLVRFFGGLAYSEYTDVVGKAHIALQPSRTTRDGETEGGAPTTLLEMQAAGLPVVATRHADIPHVVAQPEDLVAENDVTGLARALVRIAGASEAEWNARVQAGRRFVERQHAAPEVASRVVEAYSAALATTSSASGKTAATRNAELSPTAP